MMHKLIGKAVEVSTAETLYTGVLVEIGEDEVHLQSETGCIVVPLEKVVDIKALT